MAAGHRHLGGLKRVQIAAEVDEQQIALVAGAWRWRFALPGRSMASRAAIVFWVRTLRSGA